jgi:hypothetical protein
MNMYKQSFDLLDPIKVLRTIDMVSTMTQKMQDSISEIWEIISFAAGKMKFLAFSLLSLIDATSTQNFGSFVLDMGKRC